ncbi:unnamed protein product [Mytilus edulis]|uniref:SH3 domain-containing protein n=1 Tax=Mytilus edulis TaxID=6550 RepID=A0A8S3QVK0_MYTED|nr:unnamed protein product [Mytilus edulis]
MNGGLNLCQLSFSVRNKDPPRRPSPTLPAEYFNVNDNQHSKQVSDIKDAPEPIPPLPPRTHIYSNTSVSKNQKGKFKAFVRFERIAEDEDELTLLEDQIVNVIECIDEGWWLGEIDGCKGLFPSNFVEMKAIAQCGISYKKTDIQQRNSQRVIPEVLTRLDHESVSTYLRCLKDGEERSNGIRLVIVGRKNTGKTCLTQRLLKESLENVQKTNGIEIHTLKCRGKIDEGDWIFHDGYLFSKRPDGSESEKADNAFNVCNLEESDVNPTTSYQAQEDPEQDFYDLYDIVYADIDAEDTAPIAIWDFAGDRETLQYTSDLFGQESIYVVVTNVMDTIENDDLEYGLSFWLETIRCHCKLPVDEEYYNEYQEPPVIIVGTHKDQFTVNDTDDEFDILRRDIVEIAKSRNQWNIKTPARWIHLEKALAGENLYGKPVVAKPDIAEIAKLIIQPITDEEELEQFLTYHNGIGTYVYFSDLPEYVVLDPQWLASAFGCIITPDQFQKNLVHQTEWEELRQHGRLSEKLLNEIFLQQEVNIKKYKIHLLKVMEKFNIIVRPRTMSDTCEIHEETDYYVPCMIKNTSLSNINDIFYSCNSKSSCFCVEFVFLPPAFATQVLVACTRYYTVAKGPQTTDGRHPAFYRDFAIYNLDATGCEKVLIANYRNVLQMQIWKWGEPERRSYHDVKAKLIGIIEEMKKVRALPSLSYELKLKCKFTDYECLDGMVELKVINPQKEYFVKNMETPTVQMKSSLIG